MARSLILIGVAATAATLIASGCGRIGYDQTTSVDAGGKAGDADPDGAIASRFEAGVANDAGGLVDDAGGLVDDAGGSTDAPSSRPDGQPDGDDGGPASAPEPCHNVPALESAPVIDGQVEPGLALRTMPRGAWTGTTPLPAGDSASFAIAWRPDGFYLFARVWDVSRHLSPIGDPVACGDAFELYLDSDGVTPADGGYDQQGTRQLVIQAPGPTATSSRVGVVYRQGQGLGAWTSTQYVAVALPDGWAIEAFVTAADLGLSDWSLGNHDEIGLDLVHDVSTSTDQASAPECGRRLGQSLLRVDVGATGPDRLPERNARAFCTPKLQPP